MSDLTRFQEFEGSKGRWWAKRDDEAFATNSDMPSGSKVRQYARMAAAQEGAPMIVGCSAHSAMQIYVAAAAKLGGVKGIVYTAGRAEPTDATVYAKRMGAEVVEVRPAYLSVVQARAHERAAKLRKGYVRWNVDGAVDDAAEQVKNIPLEAKRIIVSTGSGLTAAGVLAGLWLIGRSNVPVVCAAVSPMAEAYKIKALALASILRLDKREGMKPKLSRLGILRCKQKYEQWEAAVLPDGSPLDPYYAAKALRYVKPGDVLWIPGVRPMSAMPAKCQDAIKALQDKKDG